MKASSLAAAAALVACSALAVPASAQSPAEATCRDAIAKSLAKYVKTHFSVIARCHEARSSGEIPLSVDCNNADDADSGGKIARAAAKLRAAVGGSSNKCLGADNLLAAQYPECPAPAESIDDGGATTGIDNFPELASCLIALTDAAMESGLDEGVGTPGEVLQPATLECQQTLASSLSRLVLTILKERRKCQRTLDRQHIGLDYNCDSADPKGKIGRALVLLNAAIEQGCNLSQPELVKINACSDMTVGLRDCVGDDVGKPLGSELIRNAYELPGGGTATTTTMVGNTTTTAGPTTTTTLSNDCGNTFPACGGDCPNGTTCTNTGALCQCVSTGGCAPATIFRRYKSQLGDYPNSTRATQLSTGWSGTTHQSDIPGDGNSADVVNVTCNANCENCNINLNPVKDTSQSYCRCNNDPRVSCDTVNAADADDCGAVNNVCTCYFGGPLAISAGGTPVCVLNKIKNDFGGTMNLRTGEWYDTTSLVSVVHLGVSTTAPCPTCVGDTTPNDGVRNGTCTGGVASGACDTNAIHPTFGPVSFDCPPNSATNISGGGLQINLKFTTAGYSLLATLPCTSPPGTECPCRVCSADGTLGCSSNAECAAAGAGNCTAAGGAGAQPNQCDDLICSNQGRCDGGPMDTFCDGTTHPNGRGFITCVTDADCTALGQGTCSVSEKRRCFTDPILVQGHADPVNPVRGSIFCIPPTSSAAVNASGGLPGPGTFELEFGADIRCQDDPSIAYNLPDGANCGAVATTTTTTNPIPACEDGTPPLCTGTCAGIATCIDGGGGACICQAPPACGGTFPLCTGSCATGQLCLPDVTSQTCLCTVPPIG